MSSPSLGETSGQTQPIKVAVIGSGITGLALAYYLTHPDQNNKFEVTVYESHHRIGLDSQSICFEGDNYADGTFEDDISSDRADEGSAEAHFVSFSDKYKKETAQPVRPLTTTTTTKQKQSPPQPQGPRVRIDMPLRVFSTRYYPHLSALLETLGVKYRSENYQASFAQFDGKPIFRYKNYLIGKFSIPYCSPSELLQPVTRDIIRFLYQAPRDLRNGRLQKPNGLVTTFDLLEGDSMTKNDSKSKDNKNETLLEYLINEGYSEEFIYQFEIPTVASMCTCSFSAAANYPAYVIIQYQVLRSGGGVRRVESGANKVVAGLSKYITHIKCNTAVTHIQHLNAALVDGDLDGIDDNDNDNDDDDDNIDQIKKPKKGEPMVEIFDSNGERNVYNHVVFATQANQTCKILSRSLFYDSKLPLLKSSTMLPTASVPIGLETTELLSNEENLTSQLSLEVEGNNNNNNNQDVSLISMPVPEKWYDMYNILSRIPYQSSELILHGDDRFLPKDPQYQSNVNFLIPDLQTAKEYTHQRITQHDGTKFNDVASPKQPDDALLIPHGLVSPPPPVDNDDSPSDSNNTTTITNNNNNNNDNIKAGPPPSPTGSVTTLLNEPNLSRKFSENWLSTIERQPSAHAQRESLVMATPMVYQNEGMSTIWMNKVQNGLNKNCNIYQTWNPHVGVLGDNDAVNNDGNDNNDDGDDIDGTVSMGKKMRQASNDGLENVKNLYGRSFFQRPIVTFDSIEACNQLWSKINGSANIWSIGSFSLGGVPLLESGVASAYIVAMKLGAKTVIKPTETVKESRLIKSNDDKKLVLGWVNTATLANQMVELVFCIIYYILFFMGFYTKNTTTTSKKND